MTPLSERCLSVYGATKAAVIGLTKAIAADFIGRGIRCNAICPGTVETASLEERMKAQGDVKVAREAFVARQPMGRLGHPGEVAALAVYLALNESSFTTGQIHIIDGVWTCPTVISINRVRCTKSLSRFRAITA
jgi:2-keto-3-deoxy-L-fuconate dehydrogenase